MFSGYFLCLDLIEIILFCHKIRQNFQNFALLPLFSGEQIWIEALGNEDCVSGDKVIKGLEKNSTTPKKKASESYENFNHPFSTLDFSIIS